MNPKERFFKFMDSPMTWTRAILYGTAIWIFSIAFMGQLPSYIIYWFDGYVAEVIDFTTKIPLVNDEGLNPAQIAIVRDIVANTVQNGVLIGMLVVAYFWQEKKRKRLGTKGPEDPVKGYMSGK
jgi:hypothetical protein